MEGFLALLGVPQGGRKDFLVINGSERFQMAGKIASPATSSSGLHRYNTVTTPRETLGLEKIGFCRNGSNLSSWTKCRDLTHSRWP